MASPPIGLTRSRFRGRYDDYPVYEDGSDWFTIEYHYGGKPVLLGEALIYEGGTLQYRDWCHRDYMSLVNIDKDVLALGCKGYIDYYWSRDVINVIEDARELKTDGDVLEMCNCAVENCGYVHIYLVEKSEEDAKRQDQLVLNDESKRPGVVIEEFENDGPEDAPMEDEDSEGDAQEDADCGQEDAYCGQEDAEGGQEDAYMYFKGQKILNVPPLRVTPPDVGYAIVEVEHVEEDCQDDVNEDIPDVHVFQEEDIIDGTVEEMNVESQRTVVQEERNGEAEQHVEEEEVNVEADVNVVEEEVNVEADVNVVEEELNVEAEVNMVHEDVNAEDDAEQDPGIEPQQKDVGQDNAHLGTDWGDDDAWDAVWDSIINGTEYGGGDNATVNPQQADGNEHGNEEEHLGDGNDEAESDSYDSNFNDSDHDLSDGDDNAGNDEGRVPNTISKKKGAEDRDTTPTSSSNPKGKRVANEPPDSAAVTMDDDEGESDRSDCLYSSHSSDEDGVRRRWPEFNSKSDMKDPRFEEGMLFASTDILKKAVRQYGIINKVNVKIVRNIKTTVRVKCKNCTGWFLMASLNRKLNAIQVKKFKDSHTCGKELPTRFITTNWVADTYIDQFRADPKYSCRSLKYQLDKEFKAPSDKMKLWRAKKKAIQMLQKTEEEQYAKLWDYSQELRTTNGGSSVYIGCDNLIFQKIYICLAACKKGFLDGCRPLIGLDGCWLKGRYGGQMLVAVGMDGNDCIFPIAYAVVDVESTETWSWFLHKLAEDLNIQNTYHWTFMADKEKGLIRALEMLMPNSEKRFCVRHLWKNLCRVNTIKKGKELKDLLWQAAKAPYPAAFDRCMDELKEKDITAWEWLSSKPAKEWSRSHYQDRCKCDIMLNNLRECFNRYILDARDQPILTMLEMIIVQLMQRMCNRRKLAEKFQGDICPKILKKLEKAKGRTTNCWPKEATCNKFEVEVGRKFYVVDLKEWTCSCRQWQLSGIPCIHAISCIKAEKQDPVKFIHPYYSVSKFKAAYAPVINPLRDMDDYAKTDRAPIKPPLMKIKKGRPQKVRRKGRDEAPHINKDGVHVVSLKGSMVMTCKSCGQIGHNKRTCGRRAAQSSSLLGAAPSDPTDSVAPSSSQIRSEAPQPPPSASEPAAPTSASTRRKSKRGSGNPEFLSQQPRKTRRKDGNPKSMSQPPPTDN